MEGGWAGCPHGASRSLPIRRVVGRFWRREVWARASRMAASLGREKIERGKQAGLCSQFPFGPGHCSCCREESGFPAEESCQGPRRPIPAGPPAPLGLTENLALPGGGCRTWRLGNVELNFTALSQMMSWRWKSLSFGFSHGHPSPMPLTWDSPVCPQVPVSVGSVLPLPFCPCPRSPAHWRFCR